MDWGQLIQVVQGVVIIGVLVPLVWGLKNNIDVLKTRSDETEKIIQLYKNATLDLPQMMEVMREGIKKVLDDITAQKDRDKSTQEIYTILSAVSDKLNDVEKSIEKQPKQWKQHTERKFAFKDAIDDSVIIPARRTNIGDILEATAKQRKKDFDD